MGGHERDCDITIGGEGSPLVEAFTAEPFAVALGISTRAGLAYLADALDLVHRLPVAHARVESLQVAPWRARKLAQATRTLSKEAAAYVDREIAPVLASCGPTRIERLVEQARAEFDTVEQAAEEEAQRAEWGIELRHAPSGRFAGTSLLEITGDTPTLTRFHDEITKIAHDLLDPHDPTTARPGPAQDPGRRRDRRPRPRRTPTRRLRAPSRSSTCTWTPTTCPTPRSGSARPNASDRSPPG